MGAPESNAGDDFHFWWAASRALELIRPGSRLRRLYLERLAKVDDPDEAYETVDVAEYVGGGDAATAEALILSQLKYSTQHPNVPWTAARLAKPRKRTRPDGGSDRPRSVIRDLADAYRKLVDSQGQEVTAKVRITLVTNQPADPLLLDSITAAADWIDKQSETPRSAELIAAMPDQQAAIIRTLREAVNDRLTSGQFCAFLTVLDLSGTGTMDREALARAVRAQAHQLTPGRSRDSSLRLFDLVRRQALPGPKPDGLTESDVLAELDAPDLEDLYPAPPLLPVIPDPLPTPSAQAIADAAVAHLGSVVVAHGGAGVGKTTALSQTPAHLPAGSVMILFDCYGGGTYLNAGEQRHSATRFAIQVINELAQHCGTPLIVQPPTLEEDLWRRFLRTLELAVATLPPGAILVLAADAADNAAIAAREAGDRSFLSELVKLRLPDRAVVVLTARSHRLPSLGATAADTVALSPFDRSTSAAHLRRYRPDATDGEADEFHNRTDGNPRAQFYALDRADQDGWDVATLLDACQKTPDLLFKDLVNSAVQVGGGDAGGEKWLAVMLALARPVSTATLAAALGIDPSAVTAFAAGLTPGVKMTRGSIQFRDEDFESYIRNRVDPSEVAAAHGQLATMFLGSRQSDPDAAAHVADHLFAAGRFDELLRLVLSEDSPVGISDGLRRQQVQGRRLDLTARAAAKTGDAATAVRIAVRGCRTASRVDTLSRLVESRLDLVARYADVELLRDHALRQRYGEWLGPPLMRLAAALSRDPDRRSDARDDLANSDGWLRRWMAGRDNETSHWRLEADDVAAAAEARYRLDGFSASIAELGRWQPDDFRQEAAAALAARLAGELPPKEAREALAAAGVGVAAQAPFLAYLSTPATPVDRAWVEEVAAALIQEPPGQRHWKAAMLDVVLRHRVPSAALLAQHWSSPLPARQWDYAGADASGTAILRCHAAAAVLNDTDLDIEALIPQSLLPTQNEKGRTDDQRGHDRREWLTVVEPIAAAALLATRVTAGQTPMDQVTAVVEADLASRLEKAGHRWFTYDPSYQAWALLTARAAIDAGCPLVVLQRLADAAPELVRDGAPELWLALAELLVRSAAHRDFAAELCIRSAAHVRAHPWSAPDRLDIIARAAQIAGLVAPDVGRTLFTQAVDAATGIDDDAARLLVLHGELADRAQIDPGQRRSVARRLVAAAEAVAMHVTDGEIVPYASIARAAARLDSTVGLAAVSRWDDEDRSPLSMTLPDALLGAVDGGGISASQALALDHLIEHDGYRISFQLDVARRISDPAAARLAMTRAARRLRRHVPARDQPALAQRLVDAARTNGDNATLHDLLDPICALGNGKGRTDLYSRSRSADDCPPEVADLLAHPADRGWGTLAQDVALLDDSRVYGQEITDFIKGVVVPTPSAQRVDALEAVAALPRRHSDTVLAVLADLLGRWRDWPGVTHWGEVALPAFVARNLRDLGWRTDTDRLYEQLRAFAGDDAIRQAVLDALPETRPRLTALGWQNVAALLAQLCGPTDAAEALLSLLEDYPSAPNLTNLELPDTADAVPMLLWSAFGHPRRAVRWRAAHATRELLADPDPAHTGPLVAALIRRLDSPDPGAFRDPSLRFYRYSAAAASLVALQRVASERPAVVRPHLADLLRHATSLELPHAQIRELARMAALAVTDPDGPTAATLLRSNQPQACHVHRRTSHAHDDRRVSEDRRYRFDQMDTIPYWYAPLGRVFDLPTDKIAELSEHWILDRWGLSSDEWMTDARELRDQRSWQRMSHRQGSIPGEESLRLYIEYHGMMAAAGQLVSEGYPVLVDDWGMSDGHPWEYWLARHLPLQGPWLADRGSPVPPEPDLFGSRPHPDDAWFTPTRADHDRAFLLVDGHLSDWVLVAGSVNLRLYGARESTYIRSALVKPDHAEDLQRALAAAPNPTDWKLPDEGEEEFEVHHGAFRLDGWLVEPEYSRESLDEHDPYAEDLIPSPPLPGRAFRSSVQATRDSTGLVLSSPAGDILARIEQWADPDAESDRGIGVASSGYRAFVTRNTLLEYLTRTDTSLIVEVQIGRQQTGTSGYRVPHSRIYLVDSRGRVSAR